MTGDPIRLALHKALSDDATLKGLVATRIYFQVAPQNATYPLVTFHRVPGRIHWTAKGKPVKADLWVCKAVATGSGSAESVEAIDDAIDGALNDAELAVAGHDVLLKPLRELDIDYPDAKGGTLYRYRGALYRLMTS